MAASDPANTSGLSSPPRQTTPTRILVLSDTHASSPQPPSAESYAYRHPLPNADVLLHAGDITNCGYIQEYEPMLAMLKAHPAELKLVIAGNHDITLDEDYYRREGHKMHLMRAETVGEVRDMWRGEEARKAGIVYLEEGISTFELRNGARFTVYSSPYQPEFCDWAFAYERDEDRFNPSPPDAQSPTANPVPDHPKIDIMLTHGPPMGILDSVDRNDEHVGCDHLFRAVQRCRPLLHCFGHIHEGSGAGKMHWATKNFEPASLDQDRVLQDRSAHIDISKAGGSPLKWSEETLFINASIMDVRYYPVNPPWLVDLELPVRE